jgi:hypothetical protein
LIKCSAKSLKFIVSRAKKMVPSFLMPTPLRLISLPVGRLG